MTTYHLHYVEGRGDESAMGAPKRKVYDAAVTRAQMIDRVDLIKARHAARELHSVSVHAVTGGESVNVTADFFGRWSSVPMRRIGVMGDSAEKKARV